MLGLTRAARAPLPASARSPSRALSSLAAARSVSAPASALRAVALRPRRAALASATACVTASATLSLALAARRPALAQGSALAAPPTTAPAPASTPSPTPATTTQTHPLLSRLRTWIRALRRGAWNVFRVMQLLAYFTPTIAGLPLLLFPGRGRHVWRSLLAQSLHWSGPTFQKLGQWASTRPDLFGPETRRDLESFHSDVPREAFHKTWATLRAALDPDALFSSFDREPIGAGCIAQVHAAVLRATGERVAVKIRRANVDWVVRRDVELMQTVAGTLEWLVPPLRWLSVSEMAENFAKFMTSQLDLRMEGHHLERFSELFAGSTNVTFPRPILSREDVLVETFEDGVLLSKFLALPTDKIPVKLRHRMAEAGMHSFLEMCIVHNYTHSDLHPGNIFLRTNPPFDLNHPERPVEFDKLVVVDAGLTTILAEQDQNNFIALFEAVVDGDGRRAATLMIERSRDPTSAIDPEGFVRGMTAIISRVQLDSFRLDRVRIGSVLEDVFNLVHKHHVKLESNFASLLVAIIVLEGVGRQLNPEMDIFLASLPMLAKAQAKYKAAVAKAGLKVGFKAIQRASRTATGGA